MFVCSCSCWHRPYHPHYHHRLLNINAMIRTTTTTMVMMMVMMMMVMMMIVVTMMTTTTTTMMATMMIIIFFFIIISAAAATCHSDHHHHYHRHSNNMINAVFNMSVLPVLQRTYLEHMERGHRHGGRGPVCLAGRYPCPVVQLGQRCLSPFVGFLLY